MDIEATTLALSTLGLAAAAASLRKLNTRLELSRAKHPSLAGHSRMARRVAPGGLRVVSDVFVLETRNVAAHVRRRRSEALAALPGATGIPVERIHLRTRKRNARGEQYAKVGEERRFEVVPEQGLKFLGNFTDYPETGLFLAPVSYTHPTPPQSATAADSVAAGSSKKKTAKRRQRPES